MRWPISSSRNVACRPLTTFTRGWRPRMRNWAYWNLPRYTANGRRRRRGGEDASLGERQFASAPQPARNGNVDRNLPRFKRLFRNLKSRHQLQMRLATGFELSGDGPTTGAGRSSQFAPRERSSSTIS